MESILSCARLASACTFSTSRRSARSSLRTPPHAMSPDASPETPAIKVASVISITGRRLVYFDSTGAGPGETGGDAVTAPLTTISPAATACCAIPAMI